MYFLLFMKKAPLEMNAPFKTIAIVFCLVSIAFCADAGPNAKGWQLLMDNKPAEAGEVFEKNTRDKNKTISAEAAEAYRGLSEVSDFLGRDNDACRYYFQSCPDKGQISAFSAGIMKAYRFSRSASGAAIKEGYSVLKALSEQPGIYCGELKDLLAQRYLNDGAVGKAQRLVNSMGSIRKWMMIGPFENISNSGFSTAYPPESEIDFSKIYPAKDGNMAKWSIVNNSAATGWIFLENHTDAVNAVFYFYCTVVVDKEREANLAFGASGSFKIFLNGSLVLADSVFRNTGIDMFMRRVRLGRGNNTLLVKICHEWAVRADGIDRLSNFNLRLLDEAYRPLEKAVYSTTIAPENTVRSALSYDSYAPSPLADSLFRPLKNRLEKNALDFDAALLCMRCYNGMDKTDEGQELAKKILSRYPNSSLWRQLYSESLIRAKKNTEGQAELKKAYTLTSLNYAAWLNELQTIAKTADPRKVIEFIHTSPQESKSSQEAQLALLNASSELGNKAEALKIIGRLEERYSGEYSTLRVLTGLYLAQGDVKKAQRFVNNYLEHERTAIPLYMTLADCALKQGDISKATGVIRDGQKYSPCNAELYYFLADKYFSLKKFKKAEECVEQCLAIMPSDANALNLKGNILVSFNKKDQARRAFYDAITFTSDDFNAWESLRALDNKPFLESLAPLPPVDSLIAASAGWEYRGHENGAILSLIDDVFLYPSRCSRQRTFMVVYLPTQSAIDIWKERTVGYNGYFQSLSIERALSYSADGTQLQADIMDDKIVFKSLQPGDCIVLEWSIKNFFMGEMARHVYGEEDFQRPFPVFDGRLRLVMPGSDTIPFHVYGDSVILSSSANEDYRVTQFYRRPYKNTLDESFMATDWPGRHKVTYSTFKGWADIVKWYDDLTRHKNDNTLELKALADSLFAHCSTPEAKVAQMHRFITGSIRYSYVPFRQSDWIPQDAHDVLATKIGDCKDMASLGKSLLTNAGVPASLVLVNTDVRHFTDHAFVGPDFNHCILCCTIGGKDRFIDLTDNNLSASTLPKDDQGAMGLIIRTGSTAVITLPFDKPENRVKRRSIVSSIDKNGVFTERGSALRTGIYAAQYRELFRFESEEKKQSVMRRILARSYPNMALDSFSIDSLLYTVSDSIHYYYAFTAKNAVHFSGTTAIIALHVADIIEPDDYPVEEKRRFPVDLYRTDFDIGEHETSGEISFPQGWKPISLPNKTSVQSPFGSYLFEFGQKGNKLLYRRKAIFNFNKQVPAAAYPQLCVFLNSISKADAVQLVFFTH